MIFSGNCELMCESYNLWPTLEFCMSCCVKLQYESIYLIDVMLAIVFRDFHLSGGARL